MRFDHPSFLLLFVTLPWFWWVGTRTRDHGNRGQTIWRLMVAACLIFGASGLAVATREAPITAMVALDLSASVPPRAQQRALARVNVLASTMHTRDRLGVVAFGADAALELRPMERVSLSAISSAVADTGSNIAAGIELAQAALPREGLRRIILMSDGRETTGRAETAAANAGAAGIPIDVAVHELEGLRQPPSVIRVVAPADVRIGEPFRVSIELGGSAGARGRLIMDRDDQPFGSRDISIPGDGATSVAVTDTHRQAGIHTYRARIEAPQDSDADSTPADAGSGAVVSVAGEQAVLYVSVSGGSLRGLLADAGFRVTHVAPESLPATAGALAPYGTLVLDDVPADRITASQMSAIAQSVVDSGGGLLLLGSSRTLDPGGYPTSPLGSLLPIDLRPRSGRRAPSLGLVLVFDKSGSMGDLAEGTPKIELARQAVMRVLDVLPATDLLGLIAFDARPVAIAPLTPVGAADARAIADRLQAIEPGGSTQIAPAAELAVQWLHGASGTTVTRRQILLISDGHTSAADAERLRVALRGGGIELSAVATGSDADRNLLRELAESSGGRVYFPADVRELPTIVAREAARSAAGAVVVERFVLRAAPHPVLAGIDRASLPFMGGYVVGAAKPTAASILTSHLDDPILSAWRAGLGRVGVFTADLGSSWSAPLRRWSDAPRLWAQTVRWLSRQAETRALRVTVAELAGGARLTVEAADSDGSFINMPDIRAVVRSPHGDSREIALTWSAPGRYEAAVPTPVAGPYVVSVAGRDQRHGTELRTVRGFYWSADRERRYQDADVPLMMRLADMTGGQRLGPTDSPFNGPRPAAYTPVWPWLTTVALVMFVLGIAVKRGFDVGRIRARLTVPVWLVRKRVAARGEAGE